MSVTDSAGRQADTLRPEDFRVYEDNTEQRLQYFVPVIAPYNVMLLLDRSGSMTGKWDFMQRVAEAFMRQLRHGDRISVSMFAEEVQTALDWHVVGSGPSPLLVDFTPQWRPAGSTRFYGSVKKVLEDRLKRPQSRHALIVLTDGRDSWLYTQLARWNRLVPADRDGGFQSLRNAARRQRTPVYFVALNTDRNQELNVGGNDEYINLQKIFPNSHLPLSYLEAVRQRMEHLAELTGGRVFYPKSLDEVIGLHSEIGRSLAASYSLGYVSANSTQDGSYRRIRVEVLQPGHRVVVSREGYTAR